MCSELPQEFIGCMPATFVPSLQVRPCPIKVFLSLSTFNAAHVRKNTRLSPPAQLNVPVPERGSLGTRLLNMMGMD